MWGYCGWEGLWKLHWLTLGNEIIIPFQRRTVPVKTAIWATHGVFFVIYFFWRVRGKFLTWFIYWRCKYILLRSKAAEMLNLMRRKRCVNSGLALPSGCTLAGFTFLSSVLVKLSLALVLPLSHNASLDQYSKGWACVGMPFQNKIFIEIVDL